MSRPSGQELAVLEALGQYGTIAAAALALDLQVSTVKSHLFTLRRRLGKGRLKSIQLLWWAIGAGYINPQAARFHEESPHGTY